MGFYACRATHVWYWFVVVWDSARALEICRSSRSLENSTSRIEQLRGVLWGDPSTWRRDAVSSILDHPDGAVDGAVFGRDPIGCAGIPGVDSDI